MANKLPRGPPTRRSERLATTTPAKTATRLAEDMPEEPLEASGIDHSTTALPTQSAEEPILASVEKDNDQPSPKDEETEQSQHSSDSDDESTDLPPSPKVAPVPDPRQPDNMSAPAMNIQSLTAAVAALQEQLRASRGVTPAQSVFGGTSFEPTGPAAIPAFAPYAANGSMMTANPNYNRKTRKTGIDPGKFDGQKDEFDTWIAKLADLFIEDAETFKNERSRMAVINASTGGLANDLLRARYDPMSKNPFKSACEMVATLAAVYFDDNQASRAREELRTMMYDPTDKTLDIHQFIGKINSLADRANIILEERKSTLLEHIPASLDPRLLNDSKDLRVSYEAFANLVAGAALS